MTNILPEISIAPHDLEELNQPKLKESTDTELFGCKSAGVAHLGIFSVGKLVAPVCLYCNQGKKTLHAYFCIHT